MQVQNKGGYRQDSAILGIPTAIYQTLLQYNTSTIRSKQSSKQAEVEKQKVSGSYPNQDKVLKCYTHESGQEGLPSQDAHLSSSILQPSKILTNPPPSKLSQRTDNAGNKLVGTLKVSPTVNHSHVQHVCRKGNQALEGGLQVGSDVGKHEIKDRKEKRDIRDRIARPLKRSHSTTAVSQTDSEQKCKFQRSISCPRRLHPTRKLPAAEQFAAGKYVIDAAGAYSKTPFTSPYQRDLATSAGSTGKTRTWLQAEGHSLQKAGSLQVETLNASLIRERRTCGKLVRTYTPRKVMVDKQLTISELELELLHQTSSTDFSFFVLEEVKRLQLFLGNCKSHTYKRTVLPNLEFKLCCTKYYERMLEIFDDPSQSQQVYDQTRGLLRLCQQLVPFSQNLCKILFDNHVIDQLIGRVNHYTQLPVGQEDPNLTFLVQDILAFFSSYVEACPNAAVYLLDYPQLSALLKLMRVKLYWLESDRVLQIFQKLLVAAPRVAFRRLLEFRIFYDVSHIMSQVVRYELQRQTNSREVSNSMRPGAILCYLPMGLHEILADIILKFCNCKQNRYFNYQNFAEQIYGYQVKQKFSQFVSMPQCVKPRILSSIKADKVLKLM